jgi:hypothetical protein
MAHRGVHGCVRDALANDSLALRFGAHPGGWRSFRHVAGLRSLERESYQKRLGVAQRETGMREPIVQLSTCALEVIKREDDACLFGFGHTVSREQAHRDRELSFCASDTRAILDPAHPAHSNGSACCRIHRYQGCP